MCNFQHSGTTGLTAFPKSVQLLRVNLQRHSIFCQYSMYFIADTDNRPCSILSSCQYDSYASTDKWRYWKELRKEYLLVDSVFNFGKLKMAFDLYSQTNKTTIINTSTLEKKLFQQVHALIKTGYIGRIPKWDYCYIILQSKFRTGNLRNS